MYNYTSDLNNINNFIMHNMIYLLIVIITSIIFKIMYPCLKSTICFILWILYIMYSSYYIGIIFGICIAKLVGSDILNVIVIMYVSLISHITSYLNSKIPTSEYEVILLLDVVNFIIVSTIGSVIKNYMVRIGGIVIKCFQNK